jgi:hypothetical protein
MSVKQGGALLHSELKMLPAFSSPMDDRTAMWVRLLAGAMIVMGVIGAIVSLWALPIR